MTTLLDVRDLKVRFALPKPSLFAPQPFLEAVRGVSFTLERGRALGIVGESGSGKTTAAMSTIRLVPAAGGEILFDGEDLLQLDDEAMRARRRDIQLIFQDPYSSLNPRARVVDIVREPMDLMNIGDADSRLARVKELFELVGLRPDQLNLFPHQFSGGQRQRISIARALTTNPRLLVCDEPVSALDVAIQAQILNLLARLKRELGLSYLFISHDLGVVRHLCDDVAVMYLGQIVEQASREELFDTPKHPYTQALLAAAPSLARRKSKGYVRPLKLSGDPPSPINPPKGCAFVDRCPLAQDLCRQEQPVLKPNGASQVACHFASE
ncbi:peptide ABC transporter ATP-binding protein [Phaeobacter gallaeciensis]|uniref:ATP-binding cassette domain-containing protein n=1 Tax=Phaeobacter gallaeciensis TaxID=60890 RepID=A0A1B0ZPZ2_9RHOB|nr:MULTISPECIES: oligopeptide/dipeptide ABC transporter ATP-binding protein [Phaeobacter]MDF1772179.1 ATP-binding cassette domain-containing protein [Pseudophaeobacter sp. bin_em_oilr2.035]ANP36235.1 peptide ABC transporter ATP-binding protein [Phaeobacter gallaeciensis]MDE4060709.1 ATP-binding cassette domain-containing protein [Phaeobacter gallaeciensis]MDE4123864.1 ATP-binding cassette domain-containing protein [Phaeobacter gallaeciensis]MDE4128198.1 ATP-binding cassette domain-containing p